MPNCQSASRANGLVAIAEKVKLKTCLPGINITNELKLMKKLFLFGTISAVLSASPLCAQTSNVNVAPKILESYVGQYELMPGFVLTIRKEGERLTGQATGQPRLRLIPTSEADFKVSGVDASLTFVKDKEGKVTQMVLHYIDANPNKCRSPSFPSTKAINSSIVVLGAIQGFSHWPAVQRRMLPLEELPPLTALTH